MTSTDTEAATGRLFLIEGADAGDALARVLDLFAIQQARLRNVEFKATDGRMTLRLETEGLAPDRADYLRRKLALLPLVTSVGLGWRR